MTFQKVKHNNKEICPICREDFELNKLSVLQCGHLFCNDCIRNAFTYSQNRCPICRNPSSNPIKLYSNK